MIHSTPTPKQLREFGLLFGGLVMLLFGLLLPWLWGVEITFGGWPWAVGGLVMAWALLWPSGLGPVHRGWMAFAGVLGWVNTRLIMALLFFGLFLPVGLLLRLTGWDPMVRRFDPDAASYRRASRPPPVNHMERPY